MKKIISVSVLFLLLVSVCYSSPWSFSFTAGFDHQSCKAQDDSANAFGLSLGARRLLNEYLDLYADASAHFGGNFKQGNIKHKNSLAGFKTHVGVLYNIPVRSDRYDMAVGLGLACARSVGSTGNGDAKIKYGFSDFGIALHGVARCKVSEKFSLVGEIDPDIYFINWDTRKENNETKTKRLDKFGIGISIKAGLSYSL